MYFYRDHHANLPTPITADIRVVAPLQCNNDNDAVIEAYNITEVKELVISTWSSCDVRSGLQ